MTEEYCKKVFGIIYKNVSNKHPDWSKTRMLIATRWCFNRNMKPKMIKRCKNESN